MEKKRVIEHFRTQSAVADALGLQQATVSRWGEVVPLHVAMRAEELTAGELKPDWSRYGLKPRKLE